MRIRKIERNEIISVCNLSRMVYDCAIRQSEPTDSKANFYFDEYIAEQNIIDNFERGQLILWGAFHKELPVGVCGMDTNGHITMLYVHPQFLRRRIGKNLVEKARIYAKMQLGLDRVTVNAIPMWTSSYFRRIGFTDINQYIDPNAGFIPLCAKSIKQIEYERKSIPKPVFLGVSLVSTAIVFVCGMGYCVYCALIR